MEGKEDLISWTMLMAVLINPSFCTLGPSYSRLLSHLTLIW